MATITTGGGGLFSTLGGLATIGGALTGNPFISALGTGLGMMSGSNAGGSQQGGLGGLADLLGGLVNNQLGGGSMTGKNTQLRGSSSDEELMKQWGANPYNNAIYGLGGFNAWRQ